MAARELEATVKAVEWYKALQKGNLERQLSTERQLKEMAAEQFGVSVATLNRALKRDRG